MGTPAALTALAAAVPRTGGGAAWLAVHPASACSAHVPSHAGTCTRQALDVKGQGFLCGTPHKHLLEQGVGVMHILGQALSLTGCTVLSCYVMQAKTGVQPWPRWHVLAMAHEAGPCPLVTSIWASSNCMSYLPCITVQDSLALQGRVWRMHDKSPCQVRLFTKQIPGRHITVTPNMMLIFCCEYHEWHTLTWKAEL